MSSDTLGPILIGYARVSTSDQTVNPQVDELVRSGVDPERIYTDVASGAKAERPGLAACLRSLQPGNVLVVAKLDRLARSVAHLVELGQELERRRVALRILNLGIDTGTPVGRLMFTIVAGIAEFELDLIRERTRAGLAAARARGRPGGRKPALTGVRLDTARTLWADPAIAVEDIAAQYKVSRRTLFRVLGPRYVPPAEE